MEEMELGNPSSGRDLLFGLVYDFAAKLGLWAGPCLRKEQSSLPRSLNIPIYSRRVLFISQNGAQEAAQRGRDRVYHQLDTAAVQLGPRTSLCPIVKTAAPLKFKK